MNIKPVKINYNNKIYQITFKEIDNDIKTFSKKGIDIDLLSKINIEKCS